MVCWKRSLRSGRSRHLCGNRSQSIASRSGEEIPFIVELFSGKWRQPMGSVPRSFIIAQANGLLETVALFREEQTSLWKSLPLDRIPAVGKRFRLLWNCPAGNRDKQWEAFHARKYSLRKSFTGILVLVGDFLGRYSASLIDLQKFTL
jgi:hypothetical protein